MHRLCTVSINIGGKTSRKPGRPHTGKNNKNKKPKKRLYKAHEVQENVKSAAKCLAPANPQEWASSLILKNKLVTDSSFLVNVLALRSF